MPQTIVNNQKWAYYTLSKQGMMVPRLGIPTTYFVQVGSGYRKKVGNPTLDEQALAYLYNGAKKIMPGRSHLGLSAPAAPKTISPRITFSPKGAALQWPPAPEEEIQGYVIERSHTPGFALNTYLRISALPQKGLTRQDLWAWEGEAVSYRIYTVLQDGSLSLRATLQGVQTPFADKYITAQFVIDGSNTTPGKLTTFRGLHIRTPEGVNGIRIATSNPVAIEDSTVLSTAHAIAMGAGNGNVMLFNNYLRGKIPATIHRASGFGFLGDFLKSYRAGNNLFRDIGGYSLGKWRGPTAAQGAPITQIYGNVFWNVQGKRSDGQGGTFADDTIISAHKESGSAVRGQSNPTQTNGFTLPVGWEFRQVLNLNGDQNYKDNLPSQFFGGLNFLGNFCLQEPGIGLMEDAFSLYKQGGESWARPIRIAGWCIYGNYGNGISSTGQRWQPGMPWNIGGQMQPADSYIAGVTQPSGSYSFPYQSMTGGLMSDGVDTVRYNQNGAFVLVEDAWTLGPGTTLGAQQGHNHQLNRIKVRYTGFDRTGTIPIAGDPRIGVYQSSKDPPYVAEGLVLTHHRGIRDCDTIAPVPDSYLPNGGISIRWTDPAMTGGNTAQNRFATKSEEEAAYYEFLAWCEAHNIGLGPQYPAPAVVYS